MNEPRMLRRRDFFRAAGLIAAPLVLPSGFLTGRTATPPSRQVTLACIGVGSMGEGNLNGFLWTPGTRIVAVCDVDRERLTKAKTRVEAHYAQHQPSGEYSGCAAYNDFREIIGRDDIDAVVVSTPDHWHVPVSLAAVRAGKDVYCEKPMTATLTEGRVLADAVKLYGRIVQVGSQQRSERSFRHACELVRNGRIGEIQTVKVGLPRGRSCGPLAVTPVPDGFDYDLWLGPAPAAPYDPKRCHYNFRFISDYSGGQMLNWGSHHLDIAQWGLGADRSGPVGVSGVGEFPEDGLYNNPVNYSLDYVYANGVRLNCSTANRGGVLFEGTEGSVFVTRGRLETKPAALLRSVIGPDEVHLYESRNHRLDFITSIRTRREPAAPAEVAHRSAAMGHIGNIALALRRKLVWDPATERFDDAEANRMLGRENRGPWQI